MLFQLKLPRSRHLSAAIIALLAITATLPAATGSEIESKVQSLVDRAIAAYAAEGEAAFVRISDPEESFRDGELYVFVLRGDVLMAHSGSPNGIGIPIIIYDWDGTNLNERLSKTASRQGAWITYHHTNPFSGRVEHKRSWLRRYDGMVFGAGYYNGG